MGFLLANFHVAALQRPKDSRTLFPLFINEAHHFINETILESLIGLRKFGIAICLSHQSLRQIRDRELRAAVLDALGTVLCFRIGLNDAEELAPIFLKTKPDDLMALRPHEALVDDGNTTTALISCPTCPSGALRLAQRPYGAIVGTATGGPLRRSRPRSAHSWPASCPKRNGGSSNRRR